MKNVIFIAPPAAGKGTISEYLTKNHHYIHLSTGDLLRNEIKKGTNIGLEIKDIMTEGKFIPDHIILPLFEKEIMKIKDKPFILDGIPRKVNQADYLSDLFKKVGILDYIVIHLDVSPEVLEQRICGRRVCKNCGSSYNIFFETFKPQRENICDQCSGELIKRDDDNIETYKLRYEDYCKKTEPLIQYYQEKGLLKIIDANRKTAEIINDIEYVIGSD